MDNALLTQALVLKLYLVGFIGALLMQSILLKWFGNNSRWGVNAGWQTEIVIWNLFGAVILFAIIRRGFESDIIMFGLLTMSLGFGANHFRALRKAPKNLSHILGASLNFLGALLILVWIGLSLF